MKLYKLINTKTKKVTNCIKLSMLFDYYFKADSEAAQKIKKYDPMEIPWTFVHKNLPDLVATSDKGYSTLDIGVVIVSKTKKAKDIFSELEVIEFVNWAHYEGWLPTFETSGNKTEDVMYYNIAVASMDKDVKFKTIKELLEMWKAEMLENVYYY